MNPLPEITQLLKALRLSGMIDNIEIRHREAITNKQSLMEFLTALLQDELIRRNNNRLGIRLRRSHINANKTLEQFDFDFNTKIDHQKIKTVATGQFFREKVPVLIVGPCGTGKSHLAQAFGHCLIRQGIDTLFFTQTQLMTTLQLAKASNLYQKKLNELAKIPILIIDDFGLKPLRSPQDEDFHELIAERYEKASTIITSNLTFSEWGQAFPNKLLGAATLDRLGHGAYKIVLEGKSYRSKL